MGVPRLRDLPWRETRDPWAILVAEVMLQQTQADRVVPKWRAFVDAYPNPASCADATLGDVLRLWQGLGYPRRARNLHDAARAIVERHGGAVPDGLAELRALPGVGPYTARAVRVFAFEHDEAVVETNIARLLARLAGARLTAKRIQAMADAIVPAGDGWAWNQVLMDLGAAVCRPVPRCAECPVASELYVAPRWSPGPRPGRRHRPASARHNRRTTAVPARLAAGSCAVLAGGAAPVAEFPAAIIAGLVADRLVVTDGTYVGLP